jgi:hypothetical protein
MKEFGTNTAVMELKSLINKTEDSYDRIKLLKDICKGETIYIVAPGPSLTTHNREKLIEKLKGKVVLACKQSYNYVKEVATFHLMSAYGYQPYTYHSDDTIVHWQLTAMNIEGEISRISNEWNHKADILIPCYSTPWVDMYNTTAFSRRFSQFETYSTGKIIWGPGIMYESGIPLAMHLGAKKIVTIGWDIGDLSKFEPTRGFKLGDENWRKEHAEDLYEQGVHAGAGPDYLELKETIDSTKEMYDYMLEKQIDFRILSDISPADSRFQRITLDEL